MSAPSSSQPGVQELSRRLGHEFKRPELLEHALTHASVLGADAPFGSNERLEFLGDRVLGLVVAEMLLEQFSQEDEGMISRRFAALVRREALVRVARDIGLADHIRLAKGEEEGSGRTNPTILADACEAVLAALYLDGGLAAATRFVRDAWRDMLVETPEPPKDAKTELQEWAQGRGLPLPGYREIDREGPAHAPLFTVEVDVTGLPPIRATGSSKRTAEQQAAEQMLTKLKSLKFE